MITGFVWSYPVKVLRWVDGDTVRIQIDLGFRIGWIGNARIATINAPELSTPEGPASKSFAESLAPVDGVFIARSRKLDQYGRPLIDLVLEDGADFGKRMLDSGHATLYQG